MKLLPLVLLALGSACSDADSPAAAPAEKPEELRRELGAAITELSARPEHHDPEVTIQHLLVAVKGGGVRSATKSPAEAEALAAELFARAKRGEDFDALVKNYTEDAHPGIYAMTLGEGHPPVYARSEMAAAALGDLAWKLQVGELGVAPYDGPLPGQPAPAQASRSPFGYHLVKRLK